MPRSESTPWAEDVAEDIYQVPCPVNTSAGIFFHREDSNKRGMSIAVLVSLSNGSYLSLKVT